jgi:hypothetical protein
MSNESSATKWIVGCSVVGILCIVVCMGVAASLITMGWRAANQGMQQAQTELARQAQLMAEGSSWSLPDGWTAPPEDALDEALLPRQVGDWERMFQTTEASIPVVNIERESRSAVYAANGQTLDVYVCRVSDDEREAVFEQAQTEISNGGVTTTGSVGSSDGTTRQQMFYQSLVDQGRGWLVWDGGWLFAIHADDQQTTLTEFMTAYFAEIEANQSSPDSTESGAAPVGDEGESPEQPSPEGESADSASAPSDSPQTPAP